MTVHFSSIQRPMRLISHQMTEVKDTLDWYPYHASNHGCPPEIPRHTLNQHPLNTCAPKLHSANAFSALKRHRPPQQVLTGNVSRSHMQRKRLFATKCSQSDSALSPFDPSHIRPQRSKKRKSVYFFQILQFEHACCIEHYIVVRACAGVQKPDDR